MNLARKKFIILFVIGLTKARDVCFKEIAASMPNQTKTDSNLRRIQDFFANYKIDYVFFATYLSSFLPEGKRLYLSVDRTNWKFGSKHINFLVITAYCNGVGIPIWFELLSKQSRGNSSPNDRMAVLRPIIKLFQSSHKIILTADREFIGNDWITFLLANKVLFYIRLKNNIKLKHNGICLNATEWLANRKVCYLDNVEIYGTMLSIGIQKGNKSNDHITVLTNGFAVMAVHTYRKRWSIEVFFQSVKERGFNLENTHLKDDARLRKLLAIVSLAFIICLKAGIWADEKLAKIRVKNHGYKENSYFRYGLDKIRDSLRIS